MGSMQWFSRRDFLKTAGAFSVVNFAMWMGGCESCQQQIAARPTRRNIANLAANDPIIQAYQAGITAMKALPASDPRNWNNQAAIHANHCPHGNWWFLPWHRWYLSYFERIVRKLSGNNDFALPYWNWTTSPAMPSVFWGNGNPMFDSTRFITASDTADPGWVGTSVIDNILSNSNFNLFASYPQSAANPRGYVQEGQLESIPHDNIHVWIGGDMGQIPIAARDPVFWCHHNMLDCLWNEWNVNRGFPNTNDSTWWNLQYNEFSDENGNPVSVPAGESVLLPIFSYQFEPCGPSHTSPGAGARSKAEIEAFLRAGAPVKLDVTQRVSLKSEVALTVGRPDRSTAKIDSQVLRDAIQPNGNRAVLLSVTGVQAPPSHDYFVRVFAGQPEATPATPITDPHYAGSFGFFADAKDMPGMAAEPGGHKLGYVVDLSPVLRSLNQSGGLPANSLDITLVPVPYERHPASAERLSIGALELQVAQIK